MFHLECRCCFVFVIIVVERAAAVAATTRAIEIRVHDQAPRLLRESAHSRRDRFGLGGCGLDGTVHGGRHVIAVVVGGCTSSVLHGAIRHRPGGRSQ